MKLLAYLLMTLSVITGTISAATAYMVPINADPERLESLKLSSNAGAVPPIETSEPILEAAKNIRDAQAERDAQQAPEPLIQPRDYTLDDLPEVPGVDAAPTPTTVVTQREADKPIAIKDDKLSQPLVELLKADEVQYVRVQTFNLAIWLTMWQSWVFVASVLVLGASAVTVRRVNAAAQREKEAAEEGSAASLIMDPRAAASAINDAVLALSDELNTLNSKEERLHAIVQRIGFVQTDLVPAFVASRPEIISRYGLGGYAEMMDVFAAGERQVNRAWSAAADGAEPEAIQAIERAEAIFPVLIGRFES